MHGRKGFVNGVYVVQVDGFPRWRYFGYNRRDAERDYRNKFNLKYKRIEWRTALY